MVPPPDPDTRFMAEALRLAREAAAVGEVPVGAVVVKDGAIIGRGRNRTRDLGQADAHAEMEAFRNAAAAARDWRLSGCDLYVTLEPCPMCAFAAVLYRVHRVIYGAPDPKFGGCGSVLNVPSGKFNHRVLVKGGVAGDESASLLRQFFEARR